MMTDIERIKAAFKQLKTQGYMARVNVPSCTPGCCPEFGPRTDKWEKATKYVYFTRSRGFNNGEKNISHGISMPVTVWLQWDGDAEEIIAALHAQQLPTEWWGTKANAIGVMSHSHWDKFMLETIHTQADAIPVIPTLAIT